MKTRLECCIRVWGSQHRKDVGRLEWVRGRRATEMTRGLEHLSRGYRLTEIDIRE